MTVYREATDDELDELWGYIEPDGCAMRVFPNAADTIIRRESNGRIWGFLVLATADYEAAADAFIEKLKELSANTGAMVALGVEMRLIVAAVDAAYREDNE